MFNKLITKIHSAFLNDDDDDDDSVAAADHYRGGSYTVDCAR